MIRAKRIAKRGLSWLLTLAMLLSLVGVTAFAAGEDPVPYKTTVDLLRDIEGIELSDAEWAVVEKLVPGGYSYVEPSDPGLITITESGDTKTVEAAPYTDTEGNTWSATKATLTADGKDSDVVLTEGKGSFELDEGTPYSLAVAYQLDLTISRDERAELAAALRAPAQMARGLSAMDTLAEVAESLAEDVTPVIPKLADLCDNGYDLYSDSGKYIGHATIEEKEFLEAVAALNGQYTENGGKLTLVKLLAYSEGKSDVSVANLLKNGDALAEQSVFVNEQISKLRNSDMWDYLLSHRDVLPADYQGLIDAGTRAFDTIVRKTGAVNESTWLLSADVAAVVAECEELDALTALARKVSDLSNADASFELPETLTIAKAELIKDVGMVVVTMTVKATAVLDDENTEDTVDPVIVEAIRVPEKTTSTEFLARADVAAVEERALNAWTAYSVGEKHYVRTASELPELLESDTSFTVEYTPKQYTYYINSEKSDPVDFGYWLTLPVCETEGRAYDYKIDGEYHAQGTKVQILVDGLRITRTEGKAYDVYQLDEFTARAVETGLSDAAKAVLKNPAIETPQITLRMPDKTAGLVTVDVDEAENFVITALTSDAAVNNVEGDKWVPVKALALDEKDTPLSENDFDADGKATVAKVAGLVRVAVVYRLELEDDHPALQGQIALVNLPHELAESAAEQKAALDTLLAAEVLNDFGKLDSEMLRSVKRAMGYYVDLAGEDLINGVDHLISNGVSDGKLILLGYLEQYQSEGLGFFYKTPDMAAQIRYMAEDLADARGNAGLIQACEDIKHPEYYDRIINILDKVEAANKQLTENPVDGRINTKSSSVGNLADALAEPIAEVAVPESLIQEERILAELPGLSNLSVTVRMFDADGKETGSKNKDFTYETGSNVDGRPAAFVESAKTELGFKEGLYEQSGEIPATLDESAEVEIQLAPKFFTVAVRDENGAVMKIGEVAVGKLSIELPASDNPDRVYEYSYKGNKIDGLKVYFTEEDLLAGELIIDRKVIDPLQDAISNLLAAMNREIVAGGMTVNVGGRTSGCASFIQAEDGSIVLRLTPGPNLKKSSVIGKVAETVMKGELGYIAIGDGEFFNDGSVTLQSAIDMLLNSGFGMQTMLNVINSNGDINELTLPEKANRSGDSVMALGDPIQPELLGGLLIESSLKLGLNENKTQTVKFYITMEDFDTRTSTLKTLRSNIQKFNRYFDVTAENDAVNVLIKSGPAMKAYVSAAAAAGYADLEDVKNMDHQGFIEFLYDFVQKLAEDEGINLETYINTAGEIGIDFGDEYGKYSNYLDMLYNMAMKVIKYSELSDGSQTLPLKTTDEGMQKLNEKLSQFANGMRFELADDTLTYALNVETEEIDLVALVITPNESNRNKISYASNAAELQTILDENGRKTAVILLDDLNGSITINKSVVLDLNGKTVNGDLNVSGRSKNAVIVDSTWSNTGKVTGAVNGTKVLKITGGSYSADVNAYLPNDYFVSPEGKVINRFYETAQEGDDIIINLNADRITLYGIPSWKAMAVELAFDLALNFYSAGSMTVAGNELYSAQLDDLVELVLSLSGEKAANEAIDALNLDGINGLIKLLANDFTHLEKLQGNLNGDLFTYDFSYNKWELSFEHDDSDNTLVLNLQPGDKTVEGKVIIRLKEYGEYDLNGFGGSIEEIDALLEKMVPVTTINEVSASLDRKPTYGSRTLKVSGTASGDVEFDLRDDPNYAIALGVILAKGANDNADLIAAIEKFYEDGTLTDLKAAMEAISNAEALKAFQLFRRGAGEDVFADFVKDLGLDGTVSQDCIDLARTYRAFLVTIGTAIAKSGIEGSSTELGSYEMGETGDDYGSYKVSKSGSKHLTKTVRGYTLDLTGMLESSTLILRIFKEENVIVETFDENGDSVTKYRTTDENPLNKAFEEAKDGWTIKIYDYVDLTADVEIPADTKIELVGAEFIGFAPTEGEFTGGEETSFVIILNVGSEIKSDFRFEPMEDYFKSADDRYTVQMREEDGKYIYFLQGVLVETFDENGESVTKYFIGEENALNRAFEEAKDGWTIKVYDYVDLTADVEIPADTKIEVIGAEFMGFAPVGGEFTEGEDTAFFIILNLGSEVKTDFEFDPKEDYFKSADDNYSVQVRDEYVYFLESNVLVEVLDENGNVVASYKFGDEEALNKAFDDAKDGYTIKVYGDVELTEDKTLDREISIETENDAEVKLSATITLTEDGVLTSDVELDKSKFVPEDEEKYELDEDAIGNGPYTYKLKEKEVPQPEDPEIISVPAPTGDKMAAKMTEDEEGNYFLLIDLWNVEVFDDMDFVGFITPEDLADAIDRDKIEVKNGVVKSVTIEGGVTNEVSGQTWVPTGATLIVTAENPETGVTVERRIIIVSLGDTNCNGWNESNDALLIEHHYMKATGLDDSKTLLEGYALMAADVNQKGEEDAELTPDGVESNDAYLIEVKYVHNGDYVSALA